MLRVNLKLPIKKKIYTESVLMIKIYRKLMGCPFRKLILN